MEATQEIAVAFLLGALNPIVPDEDNSFTRLARDVRSRSRSHLKAEHLIPGDVVQIEGWTLAVEDVRRNRGLVLLEFVGLDYGFVVAEDKMIRTLHRVDRYCPTRGVLWL
jgi:hypothetical protein